MGDQNYDISRSSFWFYREVQPRHWWESLFSSDTSGINSGGPPADASEQHNMAGPLNL